MALEAKSALSALSLAFLSFATWHPSHSTVVEEHCSQVPLESLCCHNANVVNGRLVQTSTACVCLKGALQSYVVLSITCQAVFEFLLLRLLCMRLDMHGCRNKRCSYCSEQCGRFNRRTAEVAPNIIYFHHRKICL